MSYRTAWRLRSVLWSIAMIVSGQVGALALEPPIQPARPSPVVIAAWEKAGAQFGWIVSDQWGNEEWRADAQKPEIVRPSICLAPAFSIPEVQSLPSPDVPFGVRLQVRRGTDLDLSVLANLKQLQWLILATTP